MEKRSAFTTNFSHEVRTPLNAILGFTQLGINATTDPLLLEYFNKITIAAKSISSMLDAIIDFERLTQADYELTMTSFHFQSFIENLPKLFDHYCSKTGNRFHLNANTALPKQLTGDPFRMEQLFGIFMQNCALHAPLSQVTCEIHAYDHDNDLVGILVKLTDDGPGIDPTLMETLYNPFGKIELPSQSRLSGLALGIPTAYQIIRKMNGELSIQNLDEGGLEVVFKLPFDEPMPSDDNLAHSHRHTLYGLSPHDLFNSISLSQETLIAIKQSDQLQPALFDLKEYIDLKKPLQSIDTLIHLYESDGTPLELKQLLREMEPMIRQYKFSDCTIIMDVILSQIEVIQI